MEIKDIRTQEDLDQELASGGDKFLLLYSAWDPFCVEFAPVFEKIAANDPGAFSRVSIDSVPDAAVLFAVEVVPAVLFFRGGKLARRLDGKPDKGLTAEELAEFVWVCRGKGKR
ncbi:MAG TPA: thioredoxin family protein [Elusimicrobiales bacterium]|nr:thioredoxin family protein [Elusimicrobiales bacterium]